MEERNTIPLSQYLVLDLETEGLDPKTDSILEVGAISIFDDLTVSSDFTNFCQGRPVAELSDFIRGMHTKNDLLADIHTAAACGWVRQERHLDADLALWLEVQGYQKGSVVLAGNSVHFDHAFIKARFPETARFLHYRVKDIGQLAREIREQCALEGIDVQRLGLWPTPEMPHRAYADAVIELDEWRQIRRAQRALIRTYKDAERLGLNRQG